MVNRRLPPPDDGEVPHEFAAVEPRQLHPTSDIRFVIRETATLTERIEGLIKTVDKLAPAFEKALEKHSADTKERFADLKANLKATDLKVVGFEKTVSFVKGALWVLGGLFAIAVVLLGVIAKGLVG